MVLRHLASRVKEAMADTPVVYVHGARQTGKSTLLQALAAGPSGHLYLTMDDLRVRDAAARDPDDFVARLAGPVCLDEAQRVPGLFLALKAAVDRNRAPGRFVLSGSANALVLPEVADALAGRVELLTLWPFSQGELAGRREAFVDRLFEGHPEARGEADRVKLFDRVVAGGYPEVQTRAPGRRRRAWFESHITMVIEREVRDLANVQDRASLRRILALLAARSATLSNVTELSRAADLPPSSLTRYKALLEAVFLIQRVRVWSGDLGKRATRWPKVVLTDTGLMSHLLGLEAGAVAADHPLAGQLLETFVAMELTKQLTWCETPASIHHLRTATQQEVDIVLERADRKLAAVEVKASRSVDRRDFRGLDWLARRVGERFAQGVVLYNGRETLPFGDRMSAVPIEALWEG